MSGLFAYRELAELAARVGVLPRYELHAHPSVIEALERAFPAGERTLPGGLLVRPPMVDVFPEPEWEPGRYELLMEMFTVTEGVIVSKESQARPAIDDAVRAQARLGLRDYHVAWIDAAGFVIAHTDAERGMRDATGVSLEECALHKMLMDGRDLRPSPVDGWYMWLPTLGFLGFLSAEADPFPEPVYEQAKGGFSRETDLGRRGHDAGKDHFT